jgi:hypothetical protein
MVKLLAPFLYNNFSKSSRRMYLLSFFIIFYGLIMYFVQKHYNIIDGEIINLQSKNNNYCDSLIDVSYNMNLTGISTTITHKYSCNILVKCDFGEYEINIKNSDINYFLNDHIKLYYYKNDVKNNKPNNIYVFEGDKYYSFALYGIYILGIVFLTDNIK